MKNIVLALFCILCSIPAFAGYDDDMPSCLNHTYLCASLLPPWQIPIPWDSYDSYNPSWGEKDVKGLAVDLIYGENASVAGLGLGLVTRCQTLWGMQLGLVPIVADGSGFQLGFFNYGRDFYGLQLGVMNWAQNLGGVQIGLVNVITESPVPVLPLVNMCF